MNVRKKSIFSIALLIILGTASIGVAQGQEDPTVVSADPNSAMQGTVELHVAIIGTGFDNSATVEFFLPNGGPIDEKITVKKVKVRGSKKLIATIDVAIDAAPDNRDIEISLSRGGRGRGTDVFRVEKNNSGGNTTPSPLADVSVTFDLVFAGPYPIGIPGLMDSNSNPRFVVNNLLGVRTYLDMTFFHDKFGEGKGAVCFRDVASDGGAVEIRENKSDSDKAELLFVFWGVLDDNRLTRVQYIMTLGGTFREGWFTVNSSGDLVMIDGTSEVEGTVDIVETRQADYTDWTIKIGAGKGKKSPDACVGIGDLYATAAVTRTR